jgi:hypothetical protein
MKDGYKENNEIFSKALRAGKRTYFFDLKEAKNNEHYLTVTESKRRFDEAQGNFVYEKHKIFLHTQDLENFCAELNEILTFVHENNLSDAHIANNDNSMNEDDSVSFEKLD